MVIKQDGRKLLDLMGSKHRETDPDDEFLDRLQKKTSFYDQPAAPPTLALPAVGAAARKVAAEQLDALVDAQVVEEEVLEGPRLIKVTPPPDEAAAAAAAEKRRKQEAEKREARFASLFDGRSVGGSERAGVPENLQFNQLARKSVPQKLPNVSTAISPEEAAARQEDAQRRAAWQELNRLREAEGGTDSKRYRDAHNRFVATWGHHGAELRE